MARVWLGCALACLPGLTMHARGETLIDTDFGGPMAPFTEQQMRANPRVRGGLPEGWMDDSAWAPVEIDYTQEEEQGLRYLRMHVRELESGRGQLACFPVADAPAGRRTYRLTMQMRSSTGKAVEIGLRQRGRPYSFYWRTLEPVPRTWKTVHHEFRAEKNDQPMGFWINTPAVGSVDVVRVRLERLSEEELVAEIRERYPDGGPANLLRNSRFPLGLQNGWALDRDSSDGDDVRVGPAADTSGPSGAPALLVEAPEGAVLCSEPFAVRCPVVKHSACLSVRGSGQWRIGVVKGGRTAAEQELDLSASDGWKRVGISFQPRLGDPAYWLRLAGTGRLYVDAVQAGPADKTGSYRSAGECEVALNVPDSDASCARIQFEDEPAVVRYCVTGRMAGATLKGKVVNVYGDESALPDVGLGDGTGAREGTWRTDRFAERPYGPVRVEAWVERGGDRVSPFNELIVYRLRRPRYWGKDAPRSPFGVHTNSTTRHNSMAKAVGINWTRLHDAGLQYIGWWNLEKEKGVWTFHDKELRRYRAHHIRILAELGTAPPWASHYADSGKKGFGYFDKFFQPKNLSEYENYVRVVTERYRDLIDAYDVWNEPWIHAWWGVDYDSTLGGRAGYRPSKEPQRDFVRLMTAAYRTAKSTDPTAPVLGFNSTTGRNSGSKERFGGDDWTRGVLEHGGIEVCDAVCYHAYTGGPVGFPGDSVETGLAVAVGPIRDKLGSVPKPVWMTEGSPVTGRMNNGMYRHTLPFDAPDDFIGSSDRLARYLTSLLANGVERIFLYSMHGHGTFSPDPKRWNVMTTDEGYLHPCGAAHSALAWHLEDTDFVRRVDVARGVHAYLFAGAGRAVAVLSSSPEHEPYSLPSGPGLAANDLFGNPLTPGTAFPGTLAYVVGETTVDTLQEALRR